MTRAPAHAASLRLTERFAFITMFTAMAAFVVGLTVLAAKTGPGAHLGLSVGASSGTELIGSGGPQPCPSSKAAVFGRAAEQPAKRSAGLNAQLTAALRAALGTKAAHVSVGVVDTATGTEAQYGPGKRYHAAGIAGADILAALLYQHQQAKVPIGKTDSGLAAEMIKNGSRGATASLWQTIGRGAGLVTANRVLGLRHTIPGTGNAWRLTRTTVADQLQLLTKLASTRSALDSACRHYELSLMSSAAPGQRWGAPAAASPHTSYAVNDGWLADPHRFVVNSIAVINHRGHELLVVVLSRNWPTKAAGISAVRTAAIAAVSAMPRGTLTG